MSTRLGNLDLDLGTGGLLIPDEVVVDPLGDTEHDDVSMDAVESSILVLYHQLTVFVAE